MTNGFQPVDGVLKIPEGTLSLPDGEFAGREDIACVILPETLLDTGLETFSGCAELREVIFPRALKSIGAACFAECPKLSKAELTEELLSVGEGAFLNCVSLKNLRFPETLTEIGAMSFWGTGIEEISIPCGVLSVGEHAFWSCEELRRADVPGRGTDIGENAFGSCYKLTQGYIAPGYPAHGDPPSELLYTLLWCSCPERHGVEMSRRAESYIEKNEALIMERIFKYDNIPALNTLVQRGLLSQSGIESYVRESSAAGKTEMTALLLRARGKYDNLDGELEL